MRGIVEVGIVSEVWCMFDTEFSNRSTQLDWEMNYPPLSFP